MIYMKLMPLDFAPESLPALRRRFSEAMRRTWDLVAEMQSDNPGPAHDRRYVFDALSGLRLLLCRVVAFSGLQPVIAGAVFMAPDAMLDIELRTLETKEHNRKLLQCVEELYQAISGDRRKLYFDWTEDGRLAFIVEEDRK